MQYYFEAVLFYYFTQYSITPVQQFVTVIIVKHNERWRYNNIHV